MVVDRIILWLLQWKLRISELAIDKPWDARASARIDALLATIEAKTDAR